MYVCMYVYATYSVVPISLKSMYVCMYVCMYMYMLHYSVVPISLKCMYVCIFVLISMNSVVSAAIIVL